MAVAGRSCLCDHGLAGLAEPPGLKDKGAGDVEVFSNGSMRAKSRFALEKCPDFDGFRRKDRFRPIADVRC